MTFFDSNTQVALIIEGVFFYSLSLPPVCANLLLSLPSMLAHLIFCRGPGAAFFASGNKKTNIEVKVEDPPFSGGVD